MIKKLLKEHSPYLLVLSFTETLLAIVSIVTFVYNDVIEINSLNDLYLLFSNIYSQTFWGFALMLLGLIAIFSITTIIYKKLEYLFMSICCWFLLFIVAFNLNQSFSNLLSVILLFVPIIIINIVSYNTEKNKLNTKRTKK